MTQLQEILGSISGSIRNIGKALVILGVIAVVAPLWSGIAIALVVGLVLLAAGALIAVFGLRAREAGKGNLGLVIGALAGIGGLVLVVQPTAGLSAVRFILILYFLASGVSEFGLAMRLEAEEGRGSTFGQAVVSLVAAFVLWSSWPISGARAVGLLVGGKLIASGLAVMRFQSALESAGDRVRGAGQAFAEARRRRGNESDTE